MVQSPTERAHELVASAGFGAVEVDDRRLKAFYRGGTVKGPRRLTVYIESDGAPWPWPDTPPGDPSPINPLVIRLAASDPSSLVGYVARPCQYLPAAELAECDPALWTYGRFRDDAIVAVEGAIETLKRLSRADELSLVGYSGGGAMAALVAQRRADVKCLVTIAAPLDTEAWTRAIGVSRLRESRNPADSAGRLADIRQTHFRGLADRVVPAGSIERFLRANRLAQVADKPSFDHDCCWLRDWSALREESCLATR